MFALDRKWAVEKKFQSSSAWENSFPDTLAIYCSDGRFGSACEEFIHEGLLIPRFDKYIIPGGASCLTLSDLTYKSYDVAKRWLPFLIDLHNTNRIICIAHEDCGFYREKFGDGDKLDKPDKLLEAQIEDLKTAAITLSVWKSSVSVELYYAKVERKADGSVISFLKVE